MKKFLSLLLSLCLLLGALPAQALAFAGDIRPAGGAAVMDTLGNGSLVLQNNYLRVIVREDGSLSTIPTAADSADPIDRQTPLCKFITYGSKHTAHPASLRPKSIKFVNSTPNASATNAIKAEYDLTVDLTKLTVSGTTSVYYELVQLKENESSAGNWGVLVSVDNIELSEQDSDKFHQTLNTDLGVFWGYTLDGFTGMGHAGAADGPAVKMSRTVYDQSEGKVLSAENSVITGNVKNLSTWQSFSQGGDWCYDYITEIYTDGYSWANPFVGLSEYYKNGSTQAYLPDIVSVTAGSDPAATRVECWNGIGYYLEGGNAAQNSERFLWGFHDLAAAAEDVPTEPDAVKVSISAKRLAAFADGSGGIKVKYVADNAALDTLKKQYGTPVALISGDYESENGEAFTFTGGAALLSPSVAATWGDGGKLVINKDGSVEQSGVSLNAPSFKFYKPKSDADKDLNISLTKDGFVFNINPQKNDAVISVDIPYAAVKLKNASADAAGNLVFGGEIGFRTVFNGAEFSLKELGYGLNDKQEFKVNGVHATGSFDTAKLMTLELASVDGEVNTFKGKERYAFSLELNAFDLFETEASLALERSKKDGSLIPDELWFYVKSNPGILLVPPIPIGQLNGGGAGFMDLASTVNGDYFAIPPIKLRGALTGTYLHLIEGTGKVVLGPSEISLKGTDVGIVGLDDSAQIIDSFGYSLLINGQERTYKGTTYKGIYFGGSQELALNLPSKTIDIFELNQAIKLGAFGGTNNGKDTVYLGIGANGTVKGRVQIPEGIPFIGGFGADAANINLIIGGQTTLPISNASVSEGMKQAFKNVDVYLGAMTGVYLGLVDARVWVLVPNIIDTDFRQGGGWDIETRWLRRLPEWDWSSKGVDPLVQAMPDDNGSSAAMPTAKLKKHTPTEFETDLKNTAKRRKHTPTEFEADLKNTAKRRKHTPTEFETSSAYKSSLPAPKNSVNSADIEVQADEDETPYILLAFDKDVNEDDIIANLSVMKKNDDNNININWLDNDKKIEQDYEGINADTDIVKNTKDNTEYRVAILRLKEGGTYSVSTGDDGPAFSKQEGFALKPFEVLDLKMYSKDSKLSGQIKYAEAKTKYVLRTYLADEKGGADYLIDEQEIEKPEAIDVSIPKSGTLAPTGNYYVTSFLMTEKEADLNNDGNNEKALAAIDSQQFSDEISYTNTKQPKAPESVTLEATGNEVMKASWEKVDKADGYRVTIYQKDGDKWVNTGFGYDLGKDSDSIDMALTVGGNAVEFSETGEASSVSPENENLSANNTYKVGVSAYTETEDGAKYYSNESESDGAYLPEYTPTDIFLAVNGKGLKADEHGIFHAYVDGSDDTLTVSFGSEGVACKVSRTDMTGNNEISANTDRSYTIPAFDGSLMFKIDGISSVNGSSAKDVTSVFLLINTDKTAPVLTLSDPVFYADTDSGAYTITGTADAGSRIIYGEDHKSVHAEDDGSFIIKGTLEEGETAASLYLCAQDSAGNSSKHQFALVARQAAAHSVTVTTDGHGIGAASPSIAAAGTKITLTAAPDAGYRFKEWQLISGNVTITNDKFTMPDGNVVVKAIFEKDSATGGLGESRTSGRNREWSGSDLPYYVVKDGKWFRDDNGRWFYYAADRTYTNEWAAIMNPYANKSLGQSEFDWFLFGNDSAMMIGRYTDVNGDTYYLNPVSDNTLGRMFVGWHWIDDNKDGISECYYFQEASDGRRGRLYKGTTTPDGYTVNEKGQWTIDGVVQTKK